MFLQSKKKRAVRWLSTPSEKAYSLKATFFYAALRLAAVNILVFSGVRMLTEIWNDMAPETGKTQLLIFETVICTALYEIFLPFLGSLFPRKEKGMRWTIVFLGLFFGARVFVRIYLNTPLELEDGFLMIGNKYLELYNAYRRTSFSMDPGVMARVPYALTCLLAALIILFYNLVYLTRKAGLWVVIPGLVWAALLLAGCAPSFGTLELFCLGVYLLIAAGVPVRVGRSVSDRGIPRKGGFGRELLQKAAAGVFLMGGMFLLSLTAEKPAQSFARDSRLSVSVREFARENAGGGGGSFLDFTFFAKSAEVSNEAPKYQDKKIMTVTVDERPTGNLYLKDFEGARYQRGRWISQDSLLREQCIRDGLDEKEIRHLLNEGTYNSISQSSPVDPLSSVFYGPDSLIKNVEYQIRYHKITGNHFPFPYFTDTEGMDDGDLIGDVLLKRSLFKRTLSCQALNNNVFSAGNIAVLSLRTVSGQEKDAWNWYNGFAGEKYRSLTGEFPEVSRLAAHYGSAGSNGSVYENNSARMSRAAQVAAHLQRMMTYSWDLDELEAGADPVEYFLSTGKRGYCVHFASAGVLILRKMGVPARYAEGYIVKQESFHENEDGTCTAQVLDRNRHAWAEIYLDNVGWIPIEMTAGYSDTSEVLQTDEEQEKKRQEGSAALPESGEPGEESETVLPEQSEPEPETETEPEEKPADPSGQEEKQENGLWELPWQSGSGTEGSGEGTGQGGEGTAAKDFGVIRKVLLGIFAAAFLLLGGICCVRSRLRAYYREVDSEFAHRSYVSMVKRINRRMAAGLRRTGRLGKRYPTDEEYGEVLKKQFTHISEGDWDTYMEIVKEAAFSADGLDREKAEFCREIYHRVRFFRV